MIVPVPSPEPVTAIIGGILGGLLAVIRGLGGGVKRAFERVATQIKYDQDVGRQNAANTSAVHRAIWTAGLRGWLPNVISFVRDLWDRVGKIVRPILQAIQRIKDTLDRLFNAYIAPILNLIQRLRKALVVLRIFHVRFAERLDKRLAELERRITEPYLLVRAKVNEIANYINLILDPEKLIRQVVLVDSIFRAWHDLAEALTGIRRGTLFGGAAAGGARTPTRSYRDAALADLAEKNLHGTGPVAQADRDALRLHREAREQFAR